MTEFLISCIFFHEGLQASYSTATLIQSGRILHYRLDLKTGDWQKNSHCCSKNNLCNGSNSAMISRFCRAVYASSCTIGSTGYCKTSCTSKSTPLDLVSVFLCNGLKCKTILLQAESTLCKWKDSFGSLQAF